MYCDRATLEAVGAWGPAIFSDDLACDVRDDYRELIEDGVDDDEAVERILAKYGEAARDPDDEPSFWLGLALTQSKIGRLRDDVRQQAIAAIDSGADLARWDDPAARRKRQAALEKARITLEGPQPAPKRLRRPARHETSLQPGDVLAFDADGTTVVLRVARIDDHRTSVAPILVALNYDGRGLPSDRRLRRLKDRRPASQRSDPVTGLMQRWSSTTFRVTVHKRIDYADAGFQVVGHIPGRRGDDQIGPQTYTGWSQLADLLSWKVS